MRKYPTKKLIQETKAIVRLYQFLKEEVGLKDNLSARALKQLLNALKPANKR